MGALWTACSGLPPFESGADDSHSRAKVAGRKERSTGIYRETEGFRCDAGWWRTNPCACDRGPLCHGPDGHADAEWLHSVHVYGHGRFHRHGGHGHGRARRCGDGCDGGDARDHVLFRHACGHVHDHGHDRGCGSVGAGVCLGSWFSPFSMRVVCQEFVH